MTIMRRRRLPDGSFGELEKVFVGETDAEKIARLEAENASLALANIEKDIRLETVEELQAEMLLILLDGGATNE
ncbi:hypothetical protein [Sporosarcina sp. SAFN-015]|uniref:hypothetical protein n=1 Tax=Sporosarcina sp. SAFN-015 TaxID=3387274 RepID=UPI003F7CDE10